MGGLRLCRASPLPNQAWSLNMMAMPGFFQNDDAKRVLPLGGFFALEAPGAGGLAALWGVDPALAWENASSALAALVAHLAPQTVWMPGYLCAHMAAAVPAAQRRFFGLTATMQPDVTRLSGVEAGDLVLAVRYFGEPPGVDWQGFVAAHPQVHFVEDCAQSLLPAVSDADWRIFSPRKVMGVPEGGILVPLSARARQAGMRGPRQPADPARVAQRALPMQMRRDHPFDNAAWHPLHQAAENAGLVNDHAMDPTALTLLLSQDPGPMIAARRANFAVLAARLADHALFATLADACAPFGFPVVLPAPDRDAILARMHREQVFPAVHWRDIAAPMQMVADHVRSASLATLPCDHRYDLQDMARVADVFLGALT